MGLKIVVAHRIFALTNICFYKCPLLRGLFLSYLYYLEAWQHSMFFCSIRKYRKTIIIKNPWKLKIDQGNSTETRRESYYCPNVRAFILLVIFIELPRFPILFNISIALKKSPNKTANNIKTLDITPRIRTHSLKRKKKNPYPRVLFFCTNKPLDPADNS